MEAVGAVSSEKTQYGGIWSSVFSKGSGWRQLGQCLLKRFSMEAVETVSSRFSLEAVGALPSQKVQYGGS